MSDKRPPSEHLPDIDFYNFTNTFLPKIDFYISDIDALIRNKKGQFMILEKKCRMAELKKCQRISYEFLHGFIIGCNGKPIHTHSLGRVENWTYYGIHLLQFEQTSFEDGKAFFDRKEVTKAEFVRICNFDSNRTKIYARGKRG